MLSSTFQYLTAWVKVYEARVIAERNSIAAAFEKAIIHKRNVPINDR